MNIRTILICLMMATVSFAGCLGNNDTVITEEGDPVTPGELPDDWPTYYVATANDLPTCDANTLGRLYYVEADTNFQACMSTGWQVVQLGNANPNVLINEPPIINVRVTMADDDLISEDGDGTYSTNIGFAWNATDVDGTIATLGIDYTGDFVIDYILTDNPSMGENIVNPTQSNEWTDLNGLIPIPVEAGLTVFRWADSISTEYTCSLSINREVTFIAIDDDNSVNTETLMFDGLSPHYSWPTFISLDWNLVELEMLGLISQDDIDWLNGADPNSPCPVPNVEVCDGIDNDLDGDVDEDWNFYSDENNCGACGVVCPAGEICDAGTCVAPTPIITNFEINPQNLRAGDHAHCDYTYPHGEDDPVFEIQWHLDGVLQSVNTEHWQIPFGTKADALLECTLITFDSSTSVAQAWIINSEPVIMHVGLTQDQPDPNSLISFECDWDIYDDNYDFLSANIEWFVDGTLVLMEHFQGDPQGGEMYTNTQSSDSLGISQNQEADVYCALNNLDDGWASSVGSISMTLTAEWNTGP